MDNEWRSVFKKRLALVDAVADTESWTLLLCTWVENFYLCHLKRLNEGRLDMHALAECRVHGAIRGQSKVVL